ncbi:MAG: flagellar biosynthesis anti-sigma factor FlgM [Phycisphaerales bacterium]|nr:flagellar biosynthesis anti-sigma factor FlgM [Phycisphaerales bacterium]
MPDPINVGISNGSHASSRILGIDRAERPSTASPARHGREPAGDRVDLSEHARHLASLRELPEIRLNKVEAAKAAIAAGDYDNDIRMNIAVERMFDDVLS